MIQNRNKLIELFIGNMSNAIVHRILEKAIDDDNIRNHYNAELKISLDKAKLYREKINPVNNILPDKDTIIIKDKITKKVNAELRIRMAKGYTNINLSIVDIFVENTLKDMKIID